MMVYVTTPNADGLLKIGACGLPLNKEAERIEAQRDGGGGHE
jgi:hypothetical protein